MEQGLTIFPEPSYKDRVIHRLAQVRIKAMSKADSVEPQSEREFISRAMRDQSQAPFGLPIELLWAITSYLTPVDLLMLRWTCTWLYAVIPDPTSTLTKIDLKEVRDVVHLGRGKGLFSLGKSEVCWGCRKRHPLDLFWPAQLSAPTRYRYCKLGGGVLHPGMTPLNYEWIQKSFARNGFKMSAGFRKSLSEFPPETRAPPFYCSCTMKPTSEHHPPLIKVLKLEHLPRDYVISTMAEFSPWQCTTSQLLEDSAFIERYMAKHHVLWICSHLNTSQETVLDLARSLKFPITWHERTSQERHCMECPTTFKFLLRREQNGSETAVQLTLHVQKTIGDVTKLKESQNRRWMTLLHNYTETAEMESPINPRLRVAK